MAVPTVRDNKRRTLNMTKEDKEYLQNNQLTESVLISCLVTCESVISKNAYLEKKWSNNYRCYNQTAGDEYKITRLEWMAYREKLRSVLLRQYSMKQIIQMTKSCKNKATQKEVKAVIEMIEDEDYILM